MTIGWWGGFERANIGRYGQQDTGTTNHSTILTNYFKNKNDMNILLINARSLSPKLFSLVDTMEETDTSLALITETWLRNEHRMNEQQQNMSDGLGYTCMRMDRLTGVGGSVAIVYKNSDITMQQLKVGGDYEIVAALGRRTGQRRKVVVICAYIPPNFDAEDGDGVLAKIVDLIGTYKRKYNSPYFVIGGNFNKREIGRELRTYPDLSLVQTPPTRGKNVLDLVLTNFPQYITEAGVTEAICNSTGTQTDHKTVFINARIPRVPHYTTETYEYIKQTEQGDIKLESYLRKIDWKEKLKDCTEPTEMVTRLHEFFEHDMSTRYETRKSTKKSTEPPWMTGGIRRLIKRRRSIFRKFGRNIVWKILKKKTTKIIKERKKAYNLQKKEKILDGSVKKFHECVRSFINNDKSKQWSPKQLYPNASEKQIAENLASFFNPLRPRSFFQFQPFRPRGRKRPMEVSFLKLKNI